MNEEALVAEARAGDIGAFTRLVERDGPACYRVCFAILRSHPDAEDAAQEAFVKAWRQLPGLRDTSAWPDWFRRIAIRAAIDRARRIRPRAQMSAILPTIQPDPSVAVVARNEIEEAFKQLSADDRAILVLRFYLDMDVPHVATALGIPVGTAKSRLHRAIERLRTIVEVAV
jgi:RNA polymerase sigma factor (sigma-70 family)